MFRIALVAWSCVLAGAAVAQDKVPYTAAEMQALLGNGLTVTTRGVEDGGNWFTSRIVMTAAGGLSGTITPTGRGPLAVSGTWKLKGAQVCRTLKPYEPKEVCETWLKSGPKEATIVIGGKVKTINKWQ